MSITKVNDTQIHQYTNIDKTYQCKSRKLVKHKFQRSTMEIQKSQKGGGLSQNGSMKTHQHVYHKMERYSMVANH